MENNILFNSAPSQQTGGFVGLNEIIKAPTKDQMLGNPYAVTAMNKIEGIGRYLNSGQYKKLGYVPNSSDNEQKYYDATPWYDQLGNSLAGFTGSAVGAFGAQMNKLEQIKHTFGETSDDYLKDTFAASEALREKYPVFKSNKEASGLLGYVPFASDSFSKWSNFIPNLGFTVGTMAGVFAENLVATAVIEAATAGAGTFGPVEAKWAKGIYDGIKSINIFNKMLKLERAAQLGVSMTEATKVFGAAGNIFRGAEAFKNGKSLAGSLHSIYGGYQLYSNSAGEALVENAQSVGGAMQDMKKTFVEQHGREPNADELKGMQDAAEGIVLPSTLGNIGVLMASNFLQEMNAFKAGKSLSSFAFNGSKVLGEKISNRIVMDNVTNSFREMTSKEIAKQTLKSTGSALLSIGAEGLEESSQGIISKATQDYFKAKYYNKPISWTDSLGEGFAYATSTEGKEEFWAGIVTGALFTGGGRAINKYQLNKDQKNLVDKEGITMQQAVSSQIDELNKITPLLKYNLATSQSMENVKAQTVIEQRIKEALAEGDTYKAGLYKKQGLIKAMLTAKFYGKDEALLSQYQSLAKLEKTDLAKYLDTDVDKLASDSEIEDAISTLKEVAKLTDIVFEKFKNPYKYVTLADPKYAKIENEEERAETFIKDRSAYEAWQAGQEMLVAQSLLAKDVTSQYNELHSKFGAANVPLDLLAALASQDTPRVNSTYEGTTTPIANYMGELQRKITSSILDLKTLEGLNKRSTQEYKSKMKELEKLYLEKEIFRPKKYTIKERVRLASLKKQKIELENDPLLSNRPKIQEKLDKVNAEIERLSPASRAKKLEQINSLRKPEDRIKFDLNSFGSIEELLKAYDLLGVMKEDIDYSADVIKTLTTRDSADLHRNQMLAALLESRLELYKNIVEDKTDDGKPQAPSVTEPAPVVPEVTPEVETEEPTPEAPKAKGPTQIKPGDTVYFKGGEYTVVSAEITNGSLTFTIEDDDETLSEIPKSQLSTEPPSTELEPETGTNLQNMGQAASTIGNALVDKLIKEIEKGNYFSNKKEVVDELIEDVRLKDYEIVETSKTFGKKVVKGYTIVKKQSDIEARKADIEKRRQEELLGGFEINDTRPNTKEGKKRNTRIKVNEEGTKISFEGFIEGEPNKGLNAAYPKMSFKKFMDSEFYKNLKPESKENFKDTIEGLDVTSVLLKEIRISNNETDVIGKGNSGITITINTKDGNINDASFAYNTSKINAKYDAELAALKPVQKEPAIKPGVEDVFESTPELANIGTAEQYSQYLDTIFPDSKVKDIVYHNTNSDKFDKFVNPFEKEWVQNGDGEGGIYFVTEKTNDSFYGKNVVYAILNVKKSRKAFSPIFGESADKFGSFEYPKLEAYKASQYDSMHVGEAISGTPPAEYFTNDSGLNETKSIAVFDSEQIHILGSTQDIEGFKKFLGMPETVSSLPIEETESLEEALDTLTEVIEIDTLEEINPISDAERIEDLAKSIAYDGTIDMEKDGIFYELHKIAIEKRANELLAESEVEEAEEESTEVKALRFKHEKRIAEFKNKIAKLETKLTKGVKYVDKKKTPLTPEDIEEIKKEIKSLKKSITKQNENFAEQVDNLKNKSNISDFLNEFNKLLLLPKTKIEDTTAAIYKVLNTIKYSIAPEWYTFKSEGVSIELKETLDTLARNYSNIEYTNPKNIKGKYIHRIVNSGISEDYKNFKLFKNQYSLHLDLNSENMKDSMEKLMEFVNTNPVYMLVASSYNLARPDNIRLYSEEPIEQSVLDNLLLQIGSVVLKGKNNPVTGNFTEEKLPDSSEVRDLVDGISDDKIKQSILNYLRLNDDEFLSNPLKDYKNGLSLNSYQAVEAFLDLLNAYEDGISLINTFTAQVIHKQIKKSKYYSEINTIYNELLTNPVFEEKRSSEPFQRVLEDAREKQQDLSRFKFAGGNLFISQVVYKRETGEKYEVSNHTLLFDNKKLGGIIELTNLETHELTKATPFVFNEQFSVNPPVDKSTYVEAEEAKREEDLQDEFNRLPDSLLTSIGNDDALFYTNGEVEPAYDQNKAIGKLALQQLHKKETTRLVVRTETPQYDNPNSPFYIDLDESVNNPNVPTDIQSLYREKIKAGEKLDPGKIMVILDTNNTYAKFGAKGQETAKGVIPMFFVPKGSLKIENGTISYGGRTLQSIQEMIERAERIGETLTEQDIIKRVTKEAETLDKIHASAEPLVFKVNGISEGVTDRKDILKYPDVKGVIKSETTTLEIDTTKGGRGDLLFYSGNFATKLEKKPIGTPVAIGVLAYLGVQNDYFISRAGKYGVEIGNNIRQKYNELRKAVGKGKTWTKEDVRIQYINFLTRTLNMGDKAVQIEFDLIRDSKDIFHMIQMTDFTMDENKKLTYAPGERMFINDVAKKLSISDENNLEEYYSYLDTIVEKLAKLSFNTDISFVDAKQSVNFVLKNGVIDLSEIDTIPYLLEKYDLKGVVVNNTILTAKNRYLKLGDEISFVKKPTVKKTASLDDILDDDILTITSKGNKSFRTKGAKADEDYKDKEIIKLVKEKLEGLTPEKIQSLKNKIYDSSVTTKEQVNEIIKEARDKYC
jgi:anti-sigma28 factor (negative regulator of flagellin synthesis)